MPAFPRGRGRGGSAHRPEPAIDTATLLHAHALLHRLLGPGLYLLLALLAVELVNLLCGRRLNGWGIVPRTPAALGGLVAAPFLHADLRHFLANFVPLVLLTALLGHLLPERFWLLTAGIGLGSGLGVWLCARRCVHLGASGLVYGLVGYLTLHGLLAGRLGALLVSLLLLALYSGLLWGLLPTTARRSWESHLAGLAVGLALAWWRV